MFVSDVGLHLLRSCRNLFKVLFSWSGQMPSLKMKTNPMSSCIKEETFSLSVCQESSKICKRKRSMTPQSDEIPMKVARACQSGRSCTRRCLIRCNFDPDCKFLHGLLLSGFQLYYFGASIIEDYAWLDLLQGNPKLKRWRKKLCRFLKHMMTGMTLPFKNVCSQIENRSLLKWW